MIASLSGTITEKSKNGIVVATASGVGYEVIMQPIKVLGYQLGQEVTLQTYLKVTDSSHELFGFENAKEKEFFKVLMTVSGIGPKTAMNILSLGSVDAIQGAIGRGDVAYLTGVSGLGKKTAERLVVELKGKLEIRKLGNYENGQSGVLGEVVEGLVALGYSAEEARGAVEGLSESGTTEDLLRQALRKMK